MSGFLPAALGTVVAWPAWGWLACCSSPCCIRIAYGHTGRACRARARCAHCAASHNTKECRNSEEPAKAKCANCGKAGHKAWMKICEQRQAELARVRLARIMAPTRLLVPRDSGVQEPHGLISPRLTSAVAPLIRKRPWQARKAEDAGGNNGNTGSSDSEVEGQRRGSVTPAHLQPSTTQLRQQSAVPEVGPQAGAGPRRPGRPTKLSRISQGQRTIIMQRQVTEPMEGVLASQAEPLSQRTESGPLAEAATTEPSNPLQE